MQAAKLALRALARCIAALDAEIAQLDEHLEQLDRAVAPRTIALLGIGPQHACQLLATHGQNITRLHGEAAFAHLCGVDPIPASFPARPPAIARTPAAIGTPTRCSI